MVDVAAGEGDAGDREGEGLARVEGKIGSVCEVEATAKGLAGAVKKDEFHLFAEGQSPEAGDFVTEMRNGTRLKDGRRVEGEGELIVGHGAGAI